jgi:trans-aconitate methyltransferase
LSDQSLAIAKKHLPDETIFIEDSFDHLQYDNSFDLLFANMSLHWSVDFTRCLSQLKTALCDSGLLALTIPLTNTFHELKEHFSIRSFLDKEIVLQQLTSLGYEIMLHEAEEIILSFATLKLALESIKKTGTNSVTRTKKTSPKKLIPLLKTASSLTYHVGYFIVKKDPSYVS